MNTCFACGRKLGANPKMVDTKEDQAPYVGIECYRKIADAGSAGWQPPKGGPRLYVLTPERRSQLAKKGILTDSVSPVPVAGKFANGCPFCKANHDPGIPCRNAQPRTGLTKPQKIERDGKLLGVNMVPVGDRKKATDSITLSRDEARTLLSVLKTTR